MPHYITLHFFPFFKRLRTFKSARAFFKAEMPRAEVLLCLGIISEQFLFLAPCKKCIENAKWTSFALGSTGFKRLILKWTFLPAVAVLKRGESGDCCQYECSLCTRTTDCCQVEGGKLFAKKSRQNSGLIDKCYFSVWFFTVYICSWL